MDSRHVEVLLRTELRRHLPQIRKTAATLVGAVAVGLVLHSRTFLQLAVPAVGISLVVPGPAETARERISGDLLHLALLPVDPGAVALAKLGTCAMLCGVGSLAFAVSGAIWMPPLVPALTPFRAALVGFVLAWAFLTVLSCLVSGLLLRMGMQFLMNSYFPIAAFGALTGLVWILDRLVPDPWGTLQDVFAGPWVPWASGAAALLVTAGVLWISWLLAASGIRDYRPEPDRLSW